jgi:DNA-binding beta-propeller fold protein YncE
MKKQKTQGGEMKKYFGKGSFLALILILSLFSLGLTAGPKLAGYHLLKKIVLGGEGFWDYLALDTETRIMYITHGTEVVLFQIDSNQKLTPISGLQGVHGVAFVPKLGRGYISNGRADVLTVFDLKTREKSSEIKTGANPDAILYDDFSDRVFSFNGRSADATAVNVTDNSAAGTIPLGGKPEFAQSDGSGTIFVNIEDTSEIAAFDSKSLQVLRRWKLAPGLEPSGLALDKKNRRLFSVCANNLLVVSNADTGVIVATAPIGSGCDGVRFDPGTGLIFSSNGEGTMTIVRQETPDKYAVLETVATARGARTLELDLQTHHVYLVTAEFAPAPAATAENPRSRPQVLPGTFQILEFGS